MHGEALAAKPTFHDKIDETLEEIDICGVIGTLHVTGTQVVTLGDTTVKVNLLQVTQVFTTDDGRTATIKNAGLSPAPSPTTATARSPSSTPTRGCPRRSVAREANRCPVTRG